MPYRYQFDHGEKSFKKKDKADLVFAKQRKKELPKQKRKEFTLDKNPYKLEAPRFPIKKKIYVATIILCTLGTFYLLLFHEFFIVKKLKIEGLERTEKQSIEESVLGVMEYKKLGIFPANSYLLINTDEIRDILLEKFPLESIIVKKEFPNKLSLTVEEKVSTFIYDNGKEYILKDNIGNTIELLDTVGAAEWDIKYKISTSTNESGEVVEEKQEVGRVHIPRTKSLLQVHGEFPIIYAEGFTEENPFDKEQIENFLQIYKYINERTPYEFAYIHIERFLPDINVYIASGPLLRFSKEYDTETQLGYLNLFLEKGHDAKYYVDLRYDKTLYWK